MKQKTVVKPQLVKPSTLFNENKKFNVEIKNVVGN